MKQNRIALLDPVGLVPELFRAELRLVSSSPRLIIISLEDLLKLAPSDADVSAVEEREADGVFEEAGEGHVFCVGAPVWVIIASAFTGPHHICKERERECV